MSAVRVNVNQKEQELKKVNTNTGQVEIYESNTVDGKETQNKIDNRDNIMKKMLASKYDDLMNEDPTP